MGGHDVGFAPGNRGGLCEVRFFHTFPASSLLLSLMLCSRWWSRMESVRKDIECFFGRLKVPLNPFFYKRMSLKNFSYNWTFRVAFGF